MRRRALGTIQITVGVAAVAGAAWVLVARSDSPTPQKPSLPEELSVASLKKQIEEGSGKIGETMRSTFQREDLTDEQRRQAGRNMRRVMMDMMDKNISEYHDAPEDGKQAVLDRQIDDFTERMKEMQERRAQRERERAADGEEPESEEQRRERFRSRMGSQTREQRKARSESSDPDKMAQRMGYMQAMRKRMQERGIEMPGRGHGGPPH